MRSHALLIVVALLAVACTTPPEQPLPITSKGDVATAPVVRQALPDTPTPDMPVAPPPAIGAVPGAPPPNMAGVTVPAGSQYVCVADRAGTRQQTTIEFAPKVAELCRRHPEMGPCQYERNICRRSGGRVFAANGVEITMQTEAEYDKKVMRVRFQAN